MSRSSEIFIEKWTAIRKKGRLHYALKQGSIMAVVVLIIRGLLKLRKTTISELITTIEFDKIAILWIGAILGYYVIMWWIYENQYKVKTSKK